MAPTVLADDAPVAENAAAALVSAARRKEFFVLDLGIPYELRVLAAVIVVVLIIGWVMRKRGRK